MVEARDIYQEHLDRLSGALWAHDYDTCCDMLALPNEIGTLDAEFTATDRGELRQTLVSFRASLGQMGATGYHRICKEAAFTSPSQDRIKGKHTTYAMRGGQYALPPWDSEMSLALLDGVWRGVQILSRVKMADASIIDLDCFRRAGSRARQRDSDQH